MSLSEKIKKLAAEKFPLVRDLRRHFHQHPELSFNEHNTCAKVENVLKESGIINFRRVTETGLVAHIEGKDPGKKTIALRADMDALPIQETSDVPYKSKVENVMHACGHDVHTSCLLGVSGILQELKNEFEGTVKLIFQPGEEKLPGGASLMIEQGVLKSPSPSSVFGQHVMPLLDAGKVGFRSGVYMASTDEIYVTVCGKGGHGAMPHLTTDPVLMASHLVVALQQIVSRMANPTIPSVLSFGKVIASGATNVIPDKVYLEGTFRTLDESWREEAHKRMIKLAHELCRSMGGECDFRIVKGYPVLINNADLTERTKKRAIGFLGKENVVDLDIWMAAEDFSFYTHYAPSCFYRLGTRNEQRGIVSSVHTSTFDIDEHALETGMGLMAFLTVSELMDF